MTASISRRARRVTAPTPQEGELFQPAARQAARRGDFWPAARRFRRAAAGLPGGDGRSRAHVIELFHGPAIGTTSQFHAAAATAVHFLFEIAASGCFSRKLKTTAI